MAIHSAKSFDNSLKQTWKVYVVSIVSIPLFVYSGEVLGSTKTNRITIIGFILIALGIFDVWSALSWRKRRMQKARQTLFLNPGNAGAVMQWYRASLALLIGCESLALYGCLLRVWGGGTLLQAIPFYICALILLLVFAPRRVNGQVSANGNQDTTD